MNRGYNYVNGNFLKFNKYYTKMCLFLPDTLLATVTLYLKILCIAGASFRYVNRHKRKVVNKCMI